MQVCWPTFRIRYYPNRAENRDFFSAPECTIPVVVTCAEIGLHEDTFSREILALRVVQLPPVNAGQDDRIIRYLKEWLRGRVAGFFWGIVRAAFPDAAFTVVVVLCLDAKVASNAANEAFRWMTALEDRAKYGETGANDAHAGLNDGPDKDVVGVV